MTTTWEEFKDELFGEPGSIERAEFERHQRWYARKLWICEAATGWLRLFGAVGEVARVFWFLALTEGNPRDGLEFSFLNDGIRPTLWHTIYSIRHDNLCPYSGIYPEGAPASLEEAYDREQAHKISAKVP